MVIICLDIGTKRIGVAATDPLGIAVHGVATVERTSKLRDFGEILKYIKERDAEKIVVGIPLDENGEHGPSAKKILEFVKEFEDFLRAEKCAVNVELWDETYSTAEAEGHLISFDVSREKRKKVIDKMAAVVILQSYIDTKI